MARFQLTAAMIINHTKQKAGSIICDGTSCSAGDYIWTGLTSATYSPAMNPLDAGATTIKNASAYGARPTPTIDGVNSVG